MPNWKLTLAYDGSSFHGWQVQPGLRTIQGTLAGALQRLTGEIVLPQGSGRTDAGVHALAQVASFSLRAPIPAPNLQLALNRTLPSSIRVTAVEEVPEDFHARHSAKRKTYEYRLFPGRVFRNLDSPSPSSQTDEIAEIHPRERICPPFLAPYVWDCSWRIDLVTMQEAAQHVMGEHDFSSFAANDPDRTVRNSQDGTQPTNIRTIFTSSWHERDGLYVYSVTGSGFLHHMVRNLVGTFAHVGAGRMAPADIMRILAAKDRRQAGPTAPASGLFLVQVEY